jgi:hypothetical protein
MRGIRTHNFSGERKTVYMVTYILWVPEYRTRELDQMYYMFSFLNLV